MNATVSAQPTENLSRSINDLVAEGGRALASDDKSIVVTRRDWSADIARLRPDVRARLMAKYAITYNGRHYEKTDYRYDSLADAVRHAKLQRARVRSAMGLRRRAENVEIPNEMEKRLMVEFGIALQDGVYTFGTFKYERLSDAVDYAQLKRQLPL